LPIISRWGNLANNPGGKLDGFKIFFFGVVSFGKSCAVLTGESPDADVDANNYVKHNANAIDNNGSNNNTYDDNDNSNNNNKKDSDNNDNCCFDSNDAFFFVSSPLLMDLQFMTAFVGVTIEIDGLHRLSSSGV
jgi:hypothetical protein